MFLNIAKLIDGDLESLVDHPLLKVIRTRREVENPIGFEYAKAHLKPLSDAVAMVESPIGDTNAVVHRILEEELTPHPVILTASIQSVRERKSAQPQWEALPIAKLLQGGGHPNACGAIQRIPDAVEYLKNTLNPKPGNGLALGDLRTCKWPPRLSMPLISAPSVPKVSKFSGTNSGS